MKKIAIMLGLMMLVSEAAYAGGTVLFMQDPTAQQYQPETTVQEVVDDTTTKGKKKSKTTRRVRIGGQHNDPYSYWNYGQVNFGSGFSSTGSGVKRY